MSFFKDFREDFSQAAKELMPGEEPLQEELEEESDVVVNTLESELDVESELSKLDGLLEKVTKEEKNLEPVIHPEKEASVHSAAESLNKIEAVPVKPAAPVLNHTIESLKKAEEDKKMSELNNESNELELDEVNTMEVEMERSLSTQEISDEVAIITEGTSIRGNLESTGSFDIRGKIDGDVACNGKLVVTGVINGNSSSSEFFADAAKIEGEVVSTGTVKIGLGSVIIGNITATSAVIAGAIKGDIDVQGPVVVDTSAVIMGNIKSRSVQINNGAVIEGFCSQSYAEIDVAGLFGEKR